MDIDDGPSVETVAPDAAGVEAAELELLRKQAEKTYEARSSVVKRNDLPRPNLSVGSFFVDANDDAERLVQQEMMRLLQYDAHAFPIVFSVEATADDIKRRKKLMNEESTANSDPNVPQIPLDYVPGNHLNSAKSALQAELVTVLQGANTCVIRDKKGSNEFESLDVLVGENTEASRADASGRVFSVTGWASSSFKEIESLKLEFDSLNDAATRLRKKNNKAEAKLSVVRGGYTKRASKVRADTLQGYVDLQNLLIEEDVYGTLQSQEISGAASRIAYLKEDIASMDAEEVSTQKKYSDWLVEKRRLALRRKNTAQ